MSGDLYGDGLALVCDAAGVVREVLHDGLGLGASIAPGTPLADAVDSGSAEQAGAFLVALRDRGAAFNWDLNVATTAGRIVPLHFVGASSGDGLLVIGGSSRRGAARLYEQIVAINGEQTTMLRQTAKELAERTREQAARDANHYEELSRLNNELATMQRELARKNAELVRLNEQKNQFVGIAAHDLRNPLEVIMTYSQFLLEDAGPVLEPPQVKFVETIRRSSRFMLELVNDLLDVSRIEAGRLELDLAETDLGALVAANVERNGALAARKRISLGLEVDGRDVHAVVDASKIEQVLNNLIGNAMKFSPEGTRVEVALRREGDAATLTVRDEGPGVAPDAVERIFAPFARGDARPDGQEKSTGLGLAIVKRIVEGHGGAIRVESHIGDGTTFVITLPLAGAAAGRPSNDP